MKKLLLFSLLVLGATTVTQAFPEYYQISDSASAQAEARQRHLPLAWVGGFEQQITEANPTRGEQADLTQMAMADLRDHAVIIFFEGTNMGPVPEIVHAQDHIADDGPLPGGASWNAPKVVFTNPAITRVLGRVSHTQMKANRDAAINNVLLSIDPSMLADAAPLPPPTDQAATTESSHVFDEPTATHSANGHTMTTHVGEESDDLSPEELEVWNGFKQNSVYIGIGLAVLLILLRVLSASKSDA